MKYGPSGLFNSATFDNTNLGESMKATLAVAANHSLAKSTWSTYSTAARMLNRCGEETGTTMDLPLNEEKVLKFVAWLLNRKLSTPTINAYLSGLRQTHLAQGLDIPTLRTPLINQILDGTKKLDAIKANSGEKRTRLAVTPLVLRTWKSELIKSDLNNTDKLLLWAVSVILFMGAFRVHEILNKKTHTFDPLFSLLLKDITIRQIRINNELTNIIQIRIKSEKKDRIGVNTIVDVYENGGQFCPVKALKKWLSASAHNNQNLPAFRWSSGNPLTGKDFNKCLKDLLEKHFDYKKSNMSSHSFRRGMATLLGHIGYTDSEIQAVGRWSSRAFEDYIKLPRTKRLQMAREIGRLNL